MAKYDELIGVLREDCFDDRDGCRVRKSTMMIDHERRRAAAALTDLQAQVAGLREALQPFAEQKTVTEMLTDPDVPEWPKLTLDDRIEAIARRKSEHDERIINARQALAQYGKDRDDA